MRPENQSKYTDRMAGIPTSRMGMLPRISPSAPGSQPSSAELGHGQSRIKKAVDNNAGKNVSKVTAGHTDGRCDLRKDIERRHHRNRCGKALHVSQKTACLNLVGCDHNKDHYRPGCFDGKIGCRASKTVRLIRFDTALVVKRAATKGIR